MPDSGLRMELVFKLKRVNENNYEKGNNYMEKLRKEIETYLPFNEQEEQDQRQFLRLLGHMPDLLTRENDVAHITVSAWIVNLDRTKVLMAYHNIYQSWAWLGGHADGNPDVRQVIRKEIEEESGLTDIRFLTDDIFSLESLTVDGHEKRGTYISSHLHLNLTFLLEADEHLPLRIKPDENSQIGWINISEIAEKSTEKWFVDRIYFKLCQKVLRDFPPREYYKAYEDRYKTIHQKGASWFSNTPTPIVMELLEKYGISLSSPILEIGCGEGRDAKALLEKGYCLKATDVSPEAISYCKAAFPEHISNFQTLDCLKDHHPFSYTFIYSVAVIHMLVPSKDRTDFYQFIYQHLTENGLSLICTMGDGKIERETDIRKAFRVEEREHSSGSIPVSSTSCKMVSFSTFEKELKENRFTIIEKGLTESFPDFPILMYALVKK